MRAGRVDRADDSDPPSLVRERQERCAARSSNDPFRSGRDRDVLSGLFATWFTDRTGDEITAALSGTSVLWERYRTFAEVAGGPKVTANPLFSRLHQPGVGEYLAPAMPTAFDGVHPASAAAPALGADTAAVLTEYLDLTAADIERLTVAKTIGTARA